MSLSSLEKRILQFLEENSDRSYQAQEIAHVFNYGGSKNYKKLVKALAFLERVGEIEVDSQGAFGLKAESPSKVIGIFRANDKGYGFIDYDPNEPDLFVPRGKSGSAMHGDKVEVRILKHVSPETGKGSEAEVIQVIERAASQMVGEFHAYNQADREATGYLGYVIPQGDYSKEMRVYILEGGVHPPQSTICLVEIKNYPTADQPLSLEAYVTKEIGHKDAPGVDILAILYQFGIPHEFPQAVIDQANQIEQEVEPADFEGRRDLRGDLVITIDGADAKDIDDAIYLEKQADGTYQLWVHIADVAHYVPENSPIDQEAYERGTSVYLTDRVVPMLPQRLSNGICSLNPHEDRLAVTCQMQINQEGQVIWHDLYLSVINSKHRMTYDDVNLILEGDAGLRQEYSEIVEMLDQMAELHHILEDMRTRRGALSFDAPEAEFVVDEEGHPLEIVLRERYTAERLIESFMLVANETVAHEYTAKQWPFIYRIHEQPDAERMQSFAEFISSFGMVLRGDAETIAPGDLQATLDLAEGTPYEHVVSNMMLRSMKQAKYSEEPVGHYGLAARDYTHFTAPIRRLSDMTVHRLIHRYLEGQLSQAERDQLESKLPQIAEQASVTERRAVDAERETDALKKAEYMLDKIGQEFEGQISSITSFGMFVELPNTVEGLVTLTSLDDYYNFDDRNLLLIGERTGRVFRIGQQVTVELIDVDIEEREIDFKLINAEEVKGYLPAQSNRAKKKGKGGKQQAGKPKNKQENRWQSNRSKRNSKRSKSKNNFKMKQRNK